MTMIGGVDGWDEGDVGHTGDDHMETVAPAVYHDDGCRRCCCDGCCCYC